MCWCMIDYIRAKKRKAGAMKWVDDLKASAAAFKDWGRVLTIIGCAMAGSLVVIALELFVICLKV